MSDRIITGLDIGSSKIATVCSVVSEKTDELRVIGYNQTTSLGVKKGLIVDIDQITEAIEKSVEKTERMAGHKINQVYVSIGGPHISSFNSHGVVAVANPNDEINEDDIRRVIEAARAVSLSTTREIIAVMPREYLVDGQPGIKNPIGMSGVRLEVDTHIITASQINMKNVNRCLNDLGLENAGFIFSGLASAESVLTSTEKELGVVLVDIGGGKIDLCVFIEGALAYSSSLPVGGKNITNDIAVGLRVSLESAEKIKIFLDQKNLEAKKKSDEIDINHLQLPEEIKTISYKTLVDGILRPRLEEIYKIIFEDLEKAGLTASIPSGLVITGGGALTLKIIETGKKILGLPIRVGKPEGVVGLTDEILSPPFATVIGLIIYAKKNKLSEELGGKNFNRILKDFSLGNSVAKLKNFLKQFIP